MVLTPRSKRAIGNLRDICRLYLAGRHRIEVVDLYESGLATDEQIIATPTLLNVLPFPPGASSETCLEWTNSCMVWTSSDAHEQR